MTIKGSGKKEGLSTTVSKKKKVKQDFIPSELPSFHREIDKFVLEVESLAQANHQTMKVVTSTAKGLAKKFDTFLEEKGVVKKSEDGKTSYQIKPSDLKVFQKFLKDFTASAIAEKKTPEIFFCSLVHQYDAFLGRLMRVAFYVKPENLKTSQKQITLSELKSFDSIETAQDYLIGKEIESIIRENHDDQFTCMEKRFSLTLRKSLPIWPIFIEMTERRNIFVHCDGVVSSQYLSVCQAHGVKFEEQLKIGQRLTVNREYFEQAVDCILEVGVKLGQVLWRKLQPDKLHEADVSLHHITYDLLVDEKYTLSKTLLQFAVNILKKHSSDSMRRMNLINLAIAHYYLGEKQEASQLLDTQDWSACENQFKLAVAVLCDKYQEAEKLMQKIGGKGDVTREEYSSWPLFRTFRESEEFLRTYRKLFGKDFYVPKEDDAGEITGSNLL